MADIGKNIKKLRIEKNMKQEELAEKLFVSRQTVSNYENGKSRPDVDMMVKIAEVLETDVNTLIYKGERQRLDRKKMLGAIVRLGIVVVVSVTLYLIYNYCKRAELHMILDDILGHIVWNMCIILQVTVFPLLSVLVGYYTMDLICILFQKEHTLWKNAGVFHKITGSMIGLYHIIELPFCVCLVKETIDYYQWVVKVGEGYYSSSIDLLPFWNKIVVWFMEFQGLMPVVFVAIFVALGIIFRFTKPKKKEALEKV